MTYSILIADDDAGVRKSHMLAIKNAAKGLEARIETCEAESSLQTRELLHEKKFDLIILDNDFKDDNKKGRLPGIALLQMARKNGPNIDTAVIFCSGEVYETLRPMVEKFNAVYLSKANYKLDEFTGMLGRMLRDSGS
jgi:response regulator of citrate/malate metabolism